MPDNALAEHIKSLELQRTQALVARDIALAATLHADDYQLITPAGKSFTKAAYLSAVETGDLIYTRWEAGEMAVRVSPAMAIVRYPVTLAFPSGNTVHCWHTDSYELRDGQWLAVWSQATAIKT
nr:nuclear transport factor 2 family protein [uncultured Roseateles sp.]